MKRPVRKFAVCVSNDGNEASLILGKVYQVLPDARAAKDDLVRVVDESGEDYLFDKEQFVLVKVRAAKSNGADGGRPPRSGKGRRKQAAD